MWSARRKERGTGKRKGFVAAQVIVSGVVIMGFAALSIDVGAMYNAKAELQRTADAAALAAAASLSDYSQGDPLQTATETALEYAAKNTILGESVALDPNVDIQFGRANFDDVSNTYTFTPSNIVPDAIRIQVRRTADSPNGALPLYFAGVLGKSYTDISAEAIAIMVPRDIAIVADLSGSHNDDSELRHYADTDINMFEVWDDFPGGIDDSPALWNGLGYSEGDPQAAGPAWGYMQHMGFGTETINGGYSPASDAGLVKLSYNQDWNNASVESYLSSFQAQGYSQNEINAIMSKSYDSSGAWQYRTSVALGLARWDSGIPGGLWEKLGIPPGDAGNGNGWVGSSETEWAVPFGDRSLSESRSIFLDYINGYANKTWTQMYNANSDFRYRFGAKTFMNYLMERRPYADDTPEFANAQAQPMQAVKDSVAQMINVITDLETDDLVSLEIYGTTARHEVDLTTDYASIADRLNELQAANYDSWTNMGGGIEKGMEELTGTRARGASRKVMIVLTDGKANVNADGNTGDYTNGPIYALKEAQQAANAGIQIFAVSVGVDSDSSLMEEIAVIGEGVHFHAEGSIDQYSAQLEEIFNTLGGKRPVELIR